MAITLASGINATQNRVTLTEALTASPGDLFRIDNEVVEFGGYGRLTGGRLVSHSGKVVSFSRGVNGTTAATHTATTAVLRVADGLVSAVGAPDPFVTASGASNLAAVLAEGNDTGGVGIVSDATGATDATAGSIATTVDGFASVEGTATATGTGGANVDRTATTDSGGANARNYATVGSAGGSADVSRSATAVDGDAVAEASALANGDGNASADASATAAGAGDADASITADAVDGNASTNAHAGSTTGDASASNTAIVASGAGTATAGVSATHGASVAGVIAEADTTSARMGFFGHATVTRPEVPATPTEQDIVDALVALGLITQAAP